MAKTITILPASDGTKKLIYVDYPVFKENKKATFKFHNKLKSTETTTVQFYDLGDKGGPPLDNFCDAMSGGTTLTLSNSGNTQCVLTDDAKAGYYAYTISNKDFETLDPVIIIEDFGASGAALISSGILLAGLGAVAVGALTTLIGAFITHKLRG